MTRLPVSGGGPQTERERLAKVAPVASADAFAGRWWIWPLAIYAVNRIINGIMIAVASSSSISLEDFVGMGGRHYGTDAGTAPPGYLTSATRWDGQWYWEIAAHGYPSDLPTDAAGNVQQNPWAFFPLYPSVIRGVMFVTRLDFPVASVAVSLIAGAVAMLLLYRLVVRHSDHLGACLAVLGVSTFTVSPVFQIAYTEGLALALILAVLLSVSREKWLPAALLLPLLSLTRGVVGAMAALFAVLIAVTWLKDRRFTTNLVPLFVLTFWSALLTFVWPVTAAIVTGRPNAYVETQRSWFSEVTTIPVIRFIARNAPSMGSELTAWVVALTWTVLLIWVVTLRQPNLLLRTWSAIYVVYLLAVTDWNWSNVRYFILALPVLWPLTRPDSGTARQRVTVGAILAIIGIASQWWYIRYCITISPQLVQVP
ncbi:hypothetical protein ASH01_06775 [Terrabacter sp. Soil811]|uniref:hypothetical protein n=1 Tax=Terrabacter sp. Soil811 TaxID=1736419 RepID=UPI0007023CD7|nr:hypothetical protein [Terrabacter sp. Soil811]KRF45524.1 hypothetical protein ASH01_06775 [Terrabacter sp. Soil811]